MSLEIVCQTDRFWGDSAQIRQSGPDSGVGLSTFQYASLSTVQVVPLSLGSRGNRRRTASVA